MSERHDRWTDVETGGGGAVITGLIMAALALLGLFLLFGDQIYSRAEKADSNATLSQMQPLGKQEAIGLTRHARREEERQA